MKATCIDPRDFALTLNREYTILTRRGDYIEIYNDAGMPSSYNKKFFRIAW
jgi:hypothetical protein